MVALTGRVKSEAPGAELQAASRAGRELIDDATWLALSVKERSGYVSERALDNARTILDFDLNSTKSYALQNMILNCKMRIIAAVIQANLRNGGDRERDRRLEETREQIFGEMAEEYRRLREVK